MDLASLIEQWWFWFAAVEGFLAFSIYLKLICGYNKSLPRASMSTSHSVSPAPAPGPLAGIKEEVRDVALAFTILELLRHSRHTRTHTDTQTHRTTAKSQSKEQLMPGFVKTGLL